MKTKVLAIVLVSLLIANMGLFGLGKVSQLLFWTIIAVCAAIAYYVLPKLRD